MTTEERKAVAAKRAREHRKLYPEQLKAMNAKRKQLPSCKYSEYKTNAKRRDLEFNLTLEEFKTFWQKDCSYCGDPIITVGIDRIDSNKGYILENTISCCKICNLMKNKYDADFFLSHCLKVTLRNNLA